MKRGFTLIEMLLVTCIIAVLIAASVGSYYGIMRTVEKTRAKELVQQVALALATIYDRNNSVWPLRIAAVGEKGGEIDDMIGYQFVAGETKYLSLNASGGKLVGYDRFGVLDPWGTEIIKRKGDDAEFKDVQNHRLWFAVDGDGDGIISGVDVGGETIDVRATAIVWCGGRDGNIEPYSKGVRRDDIHSWTVGQTKNVK